MGVIPEEPEGQQPSKLYRPDVDGLRGIAVLAVLAYHGFPRVLPGGYTGVDVFFVISGYLITRILLAELAAGRFSLAAFYGRRIRRIFPALALVAAATLVAGWFLLLPDEYALLGKHVAAGAAFVSNLVLAGEVGYFDVAAETKPLLHLWSLGIEEQFYIVWPLVLFAAWRARACRWPLFAVLGATLLALAAYAAVQDPDTAFFSPLTRAWELAAGALLATMPARNGARSATPRNLVAGFGLVFVAIGLVFPIGSGSLPGLSTVLPVVGTALAIAAGAGAWSNRKLLSARCLVGVGLISYPLYLWHWPLLSFARIVIDGRPSPGLVLGLLASSFVLAWLTWRLLERPVRGSAQRRRVTGVLVAAMAVVGVAGYAVYASAGVPQRDVVQAQSISGEFVWPDSRKRDPRCLQAVAADPANPKTFCVMSTDRPLSVALIGDSHANAIFPFVDGYFARQGRGVLMLGEPGCPPLPGVERDHHGCPAKTRWMLDALLSRPGIVDVYVLARWSAMERGERAGPTPQVRFYGLTMPDAPRFDSRQEILAEGLERLVTELQADGKRVTLLYGIPELDFDPRRCLPSRGGRPCVMDRAASDAWQAGYRRILADVMRRDGVRGIDLSRALCDRRRCIAVEDGQILYRDTHHLSLSGSRYLLDTGFPLD